MRWELLFGDLEAQLAAAAAAELAVEVGERTRHAQGEVTLGQRLRHAVGQPLTLGLDGAGPLRGVLTGVGPDWVLLGRDPGEQTTGQPGVESLVPQAALAWVGGLARGADVAEPGRVWARLGLRSALRAIVRDRAVVSVSTRGAPPVSGTLDRVGADHVDLALHPVDDVRRAGAVRGVRTIPLAALLGVRRC